MDAFTLMCILISGGICFIIGMLYGIRIIKKEAIEHGCATYNKYIDHFEWKKL